MAPLPHYLRLRKVLLFSLFASILLASFFFVFSESQSLHPHAILGRRNLLASKDVGVNVDDDNDNDDFLVEVVPRKKKASFSHNDELLVKKKSSLEKEETSIKKKKSTSSNNEGDLVVPEKKKKSSFSFSIDEDEEVAKSKKKKSSTTLEDDEKQVEKKKKSSSSLPSTSSKNQTKIIKTKTSNLDSNSSKKDETKLIKPSVSTSSKNKTKLIKPTSKKVDDSSSNNPTITKLKLNKVNSTSKSSNPTKTITNKSIDLLKSSSTPQNKTKSSSSSTKSLNKIGNSSHQLDATDEKNTKQKSQSQDQKRNSLSSPSWMYQNGEDEDLVSEFRDLPTKFHQSFIPDLHRISTTSKIYLTKYNKEITKGFKPYVGNKYAPSLATAISCAFIIVPFLLVSLVFSRIKAYFSLQKLIIFIQIYLSIYFAILCFSSLITGLEPLRFFYATSQATYVWLQVLQTLAYVLYLLLLLMYLVLVFSTETDMGQKFLGLAQTFVGLAVGLHYYMTVFHRVVLRQPPKTSWKIHGIYATCFLVICLFAGAERRKKAYLVEGGEESKTS